VYIFTQYVCVYTHICMCLYTLTHAYIASPQSCTASVSNTLATHWKHISNTLPHPSLTSLLCSHVRMCVYICIRVCVCVCMHTCMCVYMCIYMHTHSQTHIVSSQYVTSVRPCPYVYIRMHTHTDTHTLPHPSLTSLLCSHVDRCPLATH